MNNRQTAKLKMFVKVSKFGEDYAADFPAGSRGALLVGRMDGVIDRIKRVAAQQASTGARLTKEQAFDLLEDLMEGVADTARTVARDLKMPDLRTQLRLTPGAGEGQCLTDAQRFLDRFDPQKHADAAQIEAEFIALELPADFVAKLREYKEVVESAQGNQAGGTRTATGATEALRADFAEGMDIARGLDTICENRYGRNPQTKDARKLREWRQSRHIEAEAETAAATVTNPA